MRSVLLVIAMTSTAVADGYFEADEPFVELDGYGTAGLGFAIDDDARSPSASYDYTLRWGKTFRASRAVRPGGFLEIHSFDFATLDAAVGPQVQLRLFGQYALQLRAGVGTGSDGTYALAGAQLGSWILGTSVTARRWFDSRDTVVSLDVEICAALPFMLALALGAKN